MKLKRFAPFLGAIALVALAGCQPISPNFEAGGTVPAATEVAVVDDGAMATVITPSLRVRAEPLSTSALVAGISEGQSFRVLSRSSDGAWLELELPNLSVGSGWVTASLVSVTGDITDTPIVEVPTAAPVVEATAVPTEEPVVEPTAVPTEEPVVEPTAVPTEEPVVEPTAVPTEEPVVEPTAVPTEEPVVEPTAVPTEEPVVEPTAVPTEEPVVEPTAVPTVEPVVEPTEEPVVEPTAEPVAEPTTEAVVEPTAEAPVITAPAAGFAVVTAEPRLRVRSEPVVADDNIVGYGYPGEVFQVLATSDDGLWTQIAGSAEALENPDGGWVATEFLLLGQ